ncbi:MAG: MBL fold metallo-hydrolase [Chitinophagaceae bacterium]
MKIKQWEDKHLSHFSYAIYSERVQQIFLVDPARDPSQYIEFAKSLNARIAGVIETHPHADFVSSHAELSETYGVHIYASKLTGAAYPHQPFDEGQEIMLGGMILRAIYTPGHSPDSICISLEEDGIIKAVFTGDTLFIGDCGRPDLREKDGLNARQQLASMMYHSLRNKLLPLPDAAMVYPAHGAGTLCGRSLSKDHNSTIGRERATNWSLREMEEDEFVEKLLTDQPFIPGYFAYDVELNRNGVPAFQFSVDQVPVQPAVDPSNLDPDTWIVDGRDSQTYSRAHLFNSINIMGEGKFETWLGTIIKPGERFYLAAGSIKETERLVARAASIGYEPQIRSALVLEDAPEASPVFDLGLFTNNPGLFTIIDVRNETETRENSIFKGAINIPLAELRNKIEKIPLDKPVVVHCSGGYRSAVGSSLIDSVLGGKVLVYDLGENVRKFV